MQIKTLPDNYSGAFGDLVYTLAGCAPDEIVEVEILAAGEEPVGMKRYRGQQEYDVNVAAVMRSRLEVAPVYRDKNTIVVPERRWVEGQIRVGGEVSERRVFTAGVKPAMEHRVLSDMPSNV
ncbi:hypothetical protein LJC45_00890 [Alistipes sp. OttesenSCG-928-B03]|nr:hypothetical protein [Alistipes sp. OttesenSCG-928-B03]